VILSWDATVTGHTLQSADDLKTPAWTAVAGVTGNSITLTASGGAKFYRLEK